ncbi:NUDIX domain-containing protein [Microlunatus endophyticus]|uniref:NUDIX domain-containing protein n=1 Tax=Microlunatus endophyticus TaxID=1716077 RepID=UPI001664C5E9|nr:NUDIX domain-containing protein [Microlunatus endophyticus]
MPVSPHIARLRAKVGHDLLLLPTVAVLPMDDQGRVLLVRQTDFGTYGTVGGAIDEDESPADAGRREVREETGLEVELTQLVGAIGGPEFKIIYPNGDQVACVSIVYTARIVGDPTVVPDGDEVDAARWFSRSDLRAPTVGDFALNTFRSIGWLEGIA